MKEELRKRIEFCAYLMAEAEGFPPGRENDFWAMAEAKVMGELAAEARKISARAPAAAPEPKAKAAGDARPAPKAKASAGAAPAPKRAPRSRAASGENTGTAGTGASGSPKTGTAGRTTRSTKRTTPRSADT